jgi:enterochelin esterase-like enzyme
MLAGCRRGAAIARLHTAEITRPTDEFHKRALTIGTLRLDECSRMSRHRVLTASICAAVAVVALGTGAAVVLASKGKPRSPHAAGAAAASAGRSGAPAASAGRSVSIACRSPHLGGTLPAQVYLPAGYSTAGKRYPVVYFLHGLPASPSSYTENAFVASALASANERAIVVAPQGARDTNSDREYLDWSPQENWPAAIAHDLTTCVDARYHTIANRYGRALMGLSAGGYGAFNIGLRTLPEFAAVESWSGYFVATDPSGDHILDLGSAPANAAATVPRGTGLRAELNTWPTLIAFYVGRQDARFLTMNEQFDATLRQNGIAHTFDIYSGGHSGALWRAQAPTWLGWALSYLASVETRPRRTSR